MPERRLADPTLQRRLNAWRLEVVQELVRRLRNELSTLIAEVAHAWDAQDITSKLELGRDLQFTRINGTRVGDFVGLLLHAAMLTGPVRAEHIVRWPDDGRASRDPASLVR